MIDERKYTFTVNDIEYLIRKGLPELPLDEANFNWNFEIDKFQSTSDFPVLTIESRKDLGDTFEVKKVKSK